LTGESVLDTLNTITCGRLNAVLARELPGVPHFIGHGDFGSSSRLMCRPRRFDQRRYPSVIEETVHFRIHNGGPRGGRWNAAWRQFKDANPRATPEEIYRHAGELIYRFELIGPIVPYYSRQR